MVWHSRGFLERGIHVVSISYRFAPHVSFRELLGDCLDAYAWCQAHLPDIMRRRGRSIDMDRCISVGGSAGGTLATIIGHIARPRVRCVVNCCGIVDLTKPLPTVRVDPTFLALNEDIMTEEELQLEIRSQNNARATSWCPNLTQGLLPEHVEDEQESSCTPWVVTRATRIQYELFDQIFGRNLMIPVVFRRDTFASDRAYQDELTSFSAISMVDESYPPTIILHGVEDDIVQVEQSRSFARVLKKKRIPVREVYVPDAGHSVGLSWKVGSFG
jgi:acetyl esterase/lipase